MKSISSITKTFGGTLAATACLFAYSPAVNAADIIMAEPVAEPGLEASPQGVWSGLYAGFGVGIGAVNHDVEMPGGSLNLDGLGSDGFDGEVTLGYDFLLQNRFLLGGAVNARHGNIGTTLKADIDNERHSADVTADYGIDVIARAGLVATPQTLFYALGGYSWQNFDASLSRFRKKEDVSWNSNGFVVGAGIETALTQRVHLKTEYRYYRYATEELGGLDITPSLQAVTMGLNYRFGAPQDVTVTSDVASHDWTGVYVTGAAGGGQMLVPGSAGVALAGGSRGGVDGNGLTAQGIFGEVGVGADYEIGGGFVIGAQASARWANTRTRISSDADAGDINADYSYDVVARAGYKTSPNTLVYGLGGWSQQHLNFEREGTEIGDESADGFVVGAGVETALSDRFVLGLEYRYAQYSLDNDPSVHSGRATIKYKLF